MSDITEMKSSFLFRSWRSSQSASSTLGMSRIEVCPPSLRHVPDSFGERVKFWLLAPSPLDAAPPASRLPGIRDDFSACLADVPGPTAGPLLRRIAQAHSLRDLWHLRSEVHQVVALHHSQSKAEERLAQLNRHFPTRAPRSRFAPL